jgi:hypothetical protein
MDTLQEKDKCLNSQYLNTEISVSHGGEYEDGCLLGCCTV